MFYLFVDIILNSATLPKDLLAAFILRFCLAVWSSVTLCIIWYSHLATIRQDGRKWKTELLLTDKLHKQTLFLLMMHIVLSS
jgi:hypothetical protein